LAQTFVSSVCTSNTLADQDASKKALLAVTLAIRRRLAKARFSRTMEEYDAEMSTTSTAPTPFDSTDSISAPMRTPELSVDHDRALRSAAEQYVSAAGPNGMLSQHGELGMSIVQDVNPLLIPPINGWAPELPSPARTRARVTATSIDITPVAHQAIDVATGASIVVLVAPHLTIEPPDSGGSSDEDTEDDMPALEGSSDESSSDCSSGSDNDSTTISTFRPHGRTLDNLPSVSIITVESTVGSVEGGEVEQNADDYKAALVYYEFTEPLNDSEIAVVAETLEACTSEGRRFIHSVAQGDPTSVIIDSGAQVSVFTNGGKLNKTERIKLHGFNGKSTQADGSCHKTLSTKSGLNLKVKGHQVPNLSHDILSLGQTIRAGYEFHASDPSNVYLITPKGRKIPVDFTSGDNMFRLQLQTGDVNAVQADIQPEAETVSDVTDTHVHSEINSVSMNSSKVVADYAASIRLHSAFPHPPAARIRLTLQSARDPTVAPERIAPVKCPSCILTKTTASALSSKNDRGALVDTHESDSSAAVTLITRASAAQIPELSYLHLFEQTDFPVHCDSVADQPASVNELLELNHSDSDSELDVEADVQETAIDNGVIPPPPPLTPHTSATDTTGCPRTNLTGLRFGEEVFIDHKEYDVRIAGKPRYMQVAVDRASNTLIKVDILAKTSSGLAMDQIISQLGLNKLSYKCIVYGDGCGSMVHAAESCARHGIEWRYLVPGEQSLNICESSIRYIIENVSCMLHFAGVGDLSLSHYAAAYVCYGHFRLAGSRSRGHMSPHYLAGMGQPYIGHMHVFFSPVSVNKASHHRKKKKGDQDPRHRRRIGRFLGFTDSLTSTVCIILHADTNSVTRVRYSNVSFDVPPDMFRVPLTNQQLVKPLPVMPASPLEAMYTQYHSQPRARPIAGGLTAAVVPPDPTPMAVPFFYGDSTEQGGEAETNTEFNQLTDSELFEEAVKAEEDTSIPSPPPLSELDLGVPPPPPESTWYPLPASASSPSGSDACESVDASRCQSTDTPNEALSPDSSVVSPPSVEPTPLPLVFTPASTRSRTNLQQKVTAQTQQMMIRTQNGINVSNAWHRWSYACRTALGNRDALQHEINALSVGQSRFIPSFMILTDDVEVSVDQDALVSFMDTLHPSDLHTRVQLVHVLSMQATKDMNFKVALSNSELAPKVKAALDKELASLTSMILVEIDAKDKSLAAECLKKGTKCRPILDIKRDGRVKVRIVKQGFLEDVIQADGEAFNYYSSVTSLAQIRTLVFRPDRGTDCIATIDLDVAFLQSTPYEKGKHKFCYFKNPITGLLMLFMQLGCIYGERSAPKRWFLTLTPFLRSLGFEQGCNDKCAFYNKKTRLRLLLYVDDLILDGSKAEINSFIQKLRLRFKAKDVQWLTLTTPIDFVGMIISMTADRLWISMGPYIEKMMTRLSPESFGMTSSPQLVPIDKAIDGGDPVTWEQKKFYMTGVGCLGWLNATGRPDIAYLYGRLAQHMAAPTTSALECLTKGLAYLQQHSNLALSVSRDAQPTNAWEMFSDSDFAGNAEPNNKRRSCNGMLVTFNLAPVIWSATTSSVCFPNEDMLEPAADVSSAAAEIYAAGNASMRIMGLSYEVAELGIAFPKPWTLQIDNQAALAFIFDSVSRSKLRHIDCRQHWIVAMRNQLIMLAVHVPSEWNKSDLFTKILDLERFRFLRDLIMRPMSDLCIK